MAAERIRIVASKVSTPFSNVRNYPVEKWRKSQDLVDGQLFAIATAAVAEVINSGLRVPFGADSQIHDSETLSDGVRYYVDVNAPFKSTAEGRATIDSGTGFTSFFVDDIEVEDVKRINTRPGRDTYRVTLVVRD